MENIQFLGWSMGHGPHSSTNPLYCSRAENKLLSRDILTANITANSQSWRSTYEIKYIS